MGSVGQLDRDPVGTYDRLRVGLRGHLEISYVSHTDDEVKMESLEHV